MKKMFSYDDYMLDMITEAVNADEMKLLISQKLKDLLSSINSHPIAMNILQNSNTNTNDFKISFVDIDDSDPKKKDMVSFMVSNKVINLAAKSLGTEIKRGEEISDTEIKQFRRKVYLNQDDYYGVSGRSITKIGRLVGKLFPNEYKQSGDPGNDIESFVNMYKAARDTSNFEIVSGTGVTYWYNGERYVEGGGSLNNSCMRHSNCEDYLEFYVINTDKISLLILKDVENDEKIRGRAILWQLDSPSGRTFMDRIYTSKDSDIILFQDFAKENGWLYKKYQSMDAEGPWVDTKTGSETYITLQVDDLEDPGDGGYPYMDTMKYFDGDTVANDRDAVDDSKTLESTSGGAEEEGEWNDFYDEYLDEDDMVCCDRYNSDNCYRHDNDCFYSDYYNETICNDYAENNMYAMDHYEYGDEYREYGDYITTHEGSDCGEDYAENNFSWSDYHDEWVEEAEECGINGTVSADEVVEVYTSVDQSDKEYRIDGSDGEWWTWDNDGENYSNDIDEDELREEHGLDDEDEDEDE